MLLKKILTSINIQLQIYTKIISANSLSTPLLESIHETPPPDSPQSAIGEKCLVLVSGGGGWMVMKAAVIRHLPLDQPNSKIQLQ